MAETDAMSCLVCLEADEAESMICLELPPKGNFGQRRFWVCRSCAGLISRALTATGEAPPTGEIYVRPLGSGSMGSANRLVPGDSRVLDLVSQNQPASESPEVDRRESEGTAGSAASPTDGTIDAASTTHIPRSGSHKK